MTSDRADTAAAVTQETQAQVCTKLRVLLKQHLWELYTKTHSVTSYSSPRCHQKLNMAHLLYFSIQKCNTDVINKNE